MDVLKPAFERFENQEVLESRCIEGGSFETESFVGVPISIISWREAEANTSQEDTKTMGMWLCITSDGGGPNSND